MAKDKSGSRSRLSGKVIKALDLKKMLGKTDMSGSEAMARHRCIGNFADPILQRLEPRPLDRGTEPMSFDRETEQFLEKALDETLKGLSPTKKKKRTRAKPRPKRPIAT